MTADFGHADILPDSRLSTIHTPRNAVASVMGFWVPIYCASCGVEGGKVPVEGTTFAFWLCDPCFVKHGALTNVMVMPDEVYWAKLKQEQMEAFGGLLSNEELLSIVEADATPLATLMKTQGR